MKQSSSNRRKFLTSFSGTAVAGLLANSFAPLSAYGMAIPEDDKRYFFGPGLIYLNTGTLGPCSKEIVEATKRVWEELESLPVKFYGKFGAEPFAEQTRTTAARFLGCDFEEMMITSSTTNGMNSIAQGMRLQPGDRIILTDQEHGGGALCWHYLEKYHGLIIDSIKIPPGENDFDTILDKINKTISKKTKLISISHIFSSTGLRVPVEKVSALARSKGILCIVDGAQAAGAIKVDLKQLGCHAYATSGHKWLMGPKGTGLLYISKDAKDLIRPIQFEESHNTYNDGHGVVNLANIVGLAKAIEYLEKVGIEKIEEHNLSLRSSLIAKLSGVKQLEIASPPPGPLASPMLAYRIPGSIERTSFVRMLLDKHQLCIRPTHKQWFNGIRFSVHVFNTAKEIEKAAEILKSEV